MRALRWQDPEDRIQNDTLEAPVNREIRVQRQHLTFLVGSQTQDTIIDKTADRAIHDPAPNPSRRRP